MRAPFSADGVEHCLAQALANIRSAENSVGIEGVLTGLSDALPWLEAAWEAGSPVADTILTEVETELSRLFGDR